MASSHRNVTKKVSASKNPVSNQPLEVSIPEMPTIKVAQVSVEETASETKRRKMGLLGKFFVGLLTLIVGSGFISWYLSAQTPTFQQPRFAYVSQINYESMMKHRKYRALPVEIYAMDDLHNIITKYSLPQSLIGMVTINILEGLPATEVKVKYRRYQNPDYLQNGIISLDLIVDDSCPYEEKELDLKTFSNQRAITIPLCITTPFDTPDYKSADQLKEQDKIVVQYVLYELTYTNPAWKHIPYFNTKQLTLKIGEMHESMILTEDDFY